MISALIIAYVLLTRYVIVPKIHDNISQETKKTPYSTYAKNNSNILKKLNQDGWNKKAKDRFKYNYDINDNNLVSNLGGNKNNQDKSNNLDLSYDYSKVKSASEFDWSTLKPNYDKRLLTGHISMPAISVNLPILEGVSNANLYAGAGTLKPYQRMGQGNYALASHFMPDHQSNFSKINQLQKGNMILLSNGKHVYKYKTISVRRMPINSSSVVNDVKGKKLITLVTCTDIYGTARTVVQGKYIEKESINSKLGNYFK